MTGFLGYRLCADTCWSYGCVRCQTRHYEYEAVYQEHIHSQSKHGTEIVPIPVADTRKGDA